MKPNAVACLSRPTRRKHGVTDKVNAVHAATQNASSAENDSNDEKMVESLIHDEIVCSTT
jgi:hypothetical protein